MMRVFCHILGFVVVIFFITTRSLTAQLLLNELSADSGNNDSENDAIVEIINTGGTSIDAGCTVISNSEWVVVIPSGTMIAAGEVFIIGCSQGQNTGSNPNPSPGSGLACADCDFPNLPLDFDVCDPANAAYIDYSNTGFTLDNARSDDGDQVVLFDPMGNILDAVAWGCGSALLASDNTTLVDPACTTTTGRGGGDLAYTLGTPTWNGQGNVGSLPPALLSGAECFSSGVQYVMPSIFSGIYTILNPVQNSCNSSMVRVVGDTGVGNLGTWIQTEHPTPGEANDFVPYQFYIDGVAVENGIINNVICTTPVATTISAEIYNYQHVEDVALNTTGSRTTLGSYFSINGAPPVFWNGGISGAGTGTTTLTHTFIPADGDELVLTWDDWTQSPLNPNCCGTGVIATSNTGNDNISQNGADECYESITLRYRVETPIAGSPIITCDDAATGMFSISGVTAGTSISYELIYTGPGSLPLGNEVVTSSSTGMFTLASNTDADRNDPSNYMVRVVNLCNSIDATGMVCIGNPPCPDPQGASLNGATDPITICPADCFDLTVDGSSSSNLPDGGTIDWYYGTTSTFDPCDDMSVGYGGQLENSSEITVTGINAYTGLDIIINEILYDPLGNDGTGNANTCEAVEIAGPPGSDVSCFAITDGDWTFQIPNGTLIPSDGLFLIASSGCNMVTEIDPALIDLDISTCLCGSSGPDFNLTNGGEFLALSDPTGTVIDGVLFDTPSSGNSPSATNESTLGISPCLSYVIDEDNFTYLSADGSPGESISRIDNAGGVWTDGPPTMGGLNAANGATTTTITTANNCFDESFCNEGPYYIKGVVNPSSTSSSCTKADVTVGPFEVNVVCPEVVLSGVSSTCAPTNGSVTITINNAPPNAAITGTAITNVTTNMNYTTTDPATPMTDASGSASIQILNIIENGDYTISSINIAGSTCPTIFGVASVTVFPMPVITLSGTQNVCPGEVAQLTVAITSGIPPFDVAIDTNADMTSDYIVTLNATGILNIPTAISDAGTTIPVTILSVTDENDCSGTANGAGSIVVNTIPTAVASGTNSDVCISSNATTADLTWTITDPGVGYTVDVYDEEVGGVVLSGGNDLAGGGGDISFNQSAVPIGSSFPQTIIRYFEVTETASTCTNYTRTAVSVNLNANPDFAPIITQPTCTTDGMIQFPELTSGTYTYEYSLTGAAPYTTITPSGGNVTINVDQGMQSASTYTIRVTRTDVDPDCTSEMIENITAVTGCDMCTAPTINTQPDDAAICSTTLPATQVFMVTASNNGTGTILNYQWEVSSDGGKTYTSIMGETNASLSLNVMTASMNRNQYRVIVTDPIDNINCVSTSDAALLTINNVNCSPFPWNGN